MFGKGAERSAPVDDAVRRVVFGCSVGFGKRGRQEWGMGRQEWGMNNSAFDLLDTLRRLGVEVSVEGDDLDIDAPVGVMTPDLI